MTWYKKEQPTPFDNLPILGLQFLDGDILAELLHQSWTINQKYPVVNFPSGLKCDIWESGDPQNAGIMHLFGEMDLRYNDTCDEAYQYASSIAEQCGYYVEKVGDNQLKLKGHGPEEFLLVTYDNEQKQMLDVALVENEPYERPIHPAHRLLPDEIREKLPPLYSNKDLGLMAMAVVKYFHPLSNWTWYASEFDPEDEIFFGLVSGFAVELGLFSLAELEEIGKEDKTLPIERDLYFTPTTLKELKDQHEGRINTTINDDDSDPIPF
jgi:hypothetical protein